MYYSRVVIILFCTGVCKSVFSTYYIENLVMVFLCFLCFLSVLGFEFAVISKDLKTVIKHSSFIFFLFFPHLRQHRVIKNMYPKWF